MDTTHIEAEAKAPPKEKKDDPTYKHSDDNVGIMRKSNTVTYIAHKGTLIVDPVSELPYTHYTAKGGEADNLTLKPALLKFKVPEIAAGVTIVEADGIFDTDDCKQETRTVLPKAQLYTPINPRRRKSTPVEGVAGIKEIDPYGRPVCLSGHPLVLIGRDIKRGEYIWCCPCYHPRCSPESLLHPVTLAATGAG
ncbi:hypothetical protein hamaS1_05910 [Moorella sp. Hama-1]|nr:hypothetical protein hamaS1_05910 [Moorella sp. Hama-1]